MDEGRELIERRRQKVAALRREGIPPYPNRFKPRHTTEELRQRFGTLPAEALETVAETFALAGRVMARRDFGKAIFLQIQDRKGQLQLYLRQDALGEVAYGQARDIDLGDLIGVEGRPFRTRTGELTLRAQALVPLAKAIRPLPEKWHGLTDIETRYRQRYVDLIVNPQVRELFQRRSRIIRRLREFFDARDFLEVETPMMHQIPGGAAARPFKTHHQALDTDLYLRIAPELYLKRLLVGGFERVYEINRNFRNEGLSVQHNPEFTMVEFYQAYATYEDLMELTEELLVHLAKEVLGSAQFDYQGTSVDLTPPWERLRLEEAVLKFGGIGREVFADPEQALAYARSLGVGADPTWSRGELLTELFEVVVQPRLHRPTFILDFPVEVSPLARSRDDAPGLVERFELYIAGREIANAFSELNDPEEQRGRFEAQLRGARDDGLPREIDEDFVRALEYGMPPAAGEGIGIDRLVMLFTNAASIREVILFPQLRPER
ncbi:MAG: lysine--tRNA ligase [Deltaproteobacteria bacterium]|nr:lysine--tRNA ligase [Deltaproteobacteria bacterium]MBI3077805.1 lysine--tRNA ligase [Deltaproteobacteria bacterium]